MATSTVENYIKKVYTLQFEQGEGQTVAMGDLASSLEVTPGTATTMVKSLAKTGLVAYIPRVGVTLTDAGQQLALLVLRRHRLIELFLVKVLGMDWHEIHDEAEALEHVVSDRVLERMDELLGQPEWDPHGDPIPDAAGVMAERELLALVDCAEGDRACVRRVENQEDAFLRFLESSRLTPGARFEVRSRDAQAGLVELSLDSGGDFRLGFEAAAQISVEVEDGAS